MDPIDHAFITHLKSAITLTRRVGWAVPWLQKLSDWGRAHYSDEMMQYGAATRMSEEFLYMTGDARTLICEQQISQIESALFDLWNHHNRVMMPGTLKIYYKKPSNYGTADPLNYFSTLAWKFSNFLLPHRKTSLKEYTRSIDGLEQNYLAQAVPFLAV